MAADDELMPLLVLKGGNALEIVHQIGGRASLDLDYSIEADLTNADEIATRIEKALAGRFRTHGLVVFDFKFVPRPTNQPEGARWGGYRVEFKLVDAATYDSTASDLDRLRRLATPISSGQQRTFTIEISKHEYVAARTMTRVDGFDLYVYTPAMIATEKLRAICQQLPDQRKNPTSRPRDFYDIACTLDSGVSPGDCGELLRPIFDAKDVPLKLLREVPRSREFHEADWASVRNAVGREINGFGFYFQKVLNFIDALKPWWEEDAPG